MNFPNANCALYQQARFFCFIQKKKNELIEKRKKEKKALGIFFYKKKKTLGINRE